LRNINIRKLAKSLKQVSWQSVTVTKASKVLFFREL